jgi:RND family efflux transporter MFP subunit
MRQRFIQMVRSRRLLLAGVTVLAAAGALVANGITDRARSTQALVQWTRDAAIPTVALAQLEQGASEQDLVLPGTIQPYGKAAIYARVSGYLNSWNKDIGAPVKAGDVLALIDAPDLDQRLAQAKATQVSAEANYKIAALTAGRNETLVRQQFVSQQVADQSSADSAAKKAAAEADAANARQLEAMESFKTIVAPFDGIVTARNTDVGALINAGSAAGQELFEVSDLHRVRIYVQVPQALTADLHPGLKAFFEMPQYPDRQFDATVVSLSHAVNETSRSMLVELQADNSDGKLFGGTYCEVTFRIPSDPKIVRVPATALVPIDHGSEVAVLGREGKVTFRSIQLGRDFGDSVEVVAGLSPQDHVIDSPPETLQEGDLVRFGAATATPSSTDKMARQ